MKLRMPAYCDKFRCSADKCSDNCCIGWEIDIDEETAVFYDSVKGEFGERLKENITPSPCRGFILKGERCPFLNGDNLCEIIINLGEESLCQICSDHPRYFEWYGDIKEGGTGLCCEESARLILTAENPLEFTESQLESEKGEEVDKELFDCLFSAREKVFSLLYNNSISIAQKVGSILDFAERLQMNIDNGIYTLPELQSVNLKKNKKALLEVLKSYRNLESIDDSWEIYLERLIADYSEADKIPELSFYGRNLLIYFIYRYFLKGVFDGEILSKVKLAAISTGVILYITGKESYEKGSVRIEAAIDVCKLYSKQVEYSRENLDIIADLSYDNEFYSSENITSIFVGE